MMKYFQKVKWNVLAKKNSHYYIYSALNEKDEKKYKDSGIYDVNNFILKDKILKNSIDFNDAAILEIGCGNGRMTEFIADHFKTVYAVDIAKEMIKKAKERVINRNNINFLISDGETLEISDNNIDIVFSWIVFQHFPTKKMVINNLKEIYRVLKPSGIAKIQLRGRSAFGGSFRFFKWYYGVAFTEFEASKIISNLGFEIVAISGAGKREMEFHIKKSKNN